MADVTYGWMGKIARVDLTTGEVTSEDDAKYQKYIGGMGFGYKIMYDDVPMEVPPRDPSSEIIYAVGPLTGSGVPCSGRMNITLRSTWTKGNSIIDAHMGGHIGPELKYAGWDAIVVKGKASKPVYLKIEDDNITIEDASFIWGKGTFESNKRLTEECGRDFQVASIGPAGENLVNYSTLNTAFGNSAGAGIGAMMGSKNLKAIAVRGTHAVHIADVKKLQELNNYMLSELIGGNNNHNVPAVPQSWAEYSAVSGNNRWAGAPGRCYEKAEGGPIDTGEQPYDDINKIAYRCFKGYFDFGEVAQHYAIKSGGCQSCPVRCYTEYDMDPLADYDLPTYVSNTCMPVLYNEYYYYNLEDGKAVNYIKDFKYDGDARIVINGAGSHSMDDLGLWENYGNLNRDFRWLMESGRIHEFIDDEEFNSIPWEWQKTGDPRFVVEIQRRLAYKVGKLSDLAMGTLLWTEKWGLGQEFFDDTHGAWNQNVTYNGYPKHHSSEDSAQIGLLFNLMYNRDCMTHHCTNVAQSGSPYEVQKKVMEGFFGEGCWDAQKNYTPINENKIKVAKWSFNGKQLHDSLTVCNWMWPMTQSPAKKRNYAGDLDLEAKFYSAVTGIEITREELEEQAERISNMLRCMTAISFFSEYGITNLRETHDAIPAWIFDKEPDFKPFEEGTIKMDREDMEKAKDMWYEAMGWDVETGIPTKATLHKFDLDDMATDMENRGIPLK
ncbi:aldehyde ferredoxin oxidoreductase [Oribacterium sp. WCC10]|uniref:aldehyde ferredoxin oxidoreductase n=1 Tax=Oribacterium sp. WCC10 TaxID=1855343 RepID=UPI0008EABC70|nr:aldehyde ferredoxin oxidoreductase [Oribacterium sp. WCC10]SFG18904.1 Aldehyde:ferredoxin oxidoreductase [Oribacterium sp. WCC10]